MAGHVRVMRPDPEPARSGRVKVAVIDLLGLVIVAAFAVLAACGAALAARYTLGVFGVL